MHTTASKLNACYYPTPKVAGSKRRWLPDMDLNHDKQIQSLLCYRYTIGQTSASKVEFPRWESRIEQSHAC
jgi:hypothetical protein